MVCWRGMGGGASHESQILVLLFDLCIYRVVCDGGSVCVVWVLFMYVGCICVWCVRLRCVLAVDGRSDGGGWSMGSMGRLVHSCVCGVCMLMAWMGCMYVCNITTIGDVCRCMVGCVW